MQDTRILAPPEYAEKLSALVAAGAALLNLKATDGAGILREAVKVGGLYREIVEHDAALRIAPFVICEDCGHEKHEKRCPWAPRGCTCLVGVPVAKAAPPEKFR